MADHIAIHELLARYAVHQDDEAVDALGECFTEDADYELCVSDRDPVRRRGREAIVARMRELKSTSFTGRRRHLITNVIIDHETEDRASTRSYVTVLRLDGASTAIVAVGTYLDEVVLSDGRWRIAARRALLEPLV